MTTEEERQGSAEATEETRERAGKKIVSQVEGTMETTQTRAEDGCYLTSLG